MNSSITVNLLLNSQHAYIKCKYLEIALHILVSLTENSLQYKDNITVIAFLDIEAVFNNIRPYVIIEALTRLGVIRKISTISY